LVLNKPYGILSHPTSHSKEATVRDFLVNEFNLQIKDNNQREGIVHRLDRVTSGLMVCVLDENIFAYFQSQFKNRLINKKYRAIVEGYPHTKSGEINLPLAKSKKNNIILKNYGLTYERRPLFYAVISSENNILNIENIVNPEKWYHIGPGNVTAGMVKKSISSKGIEIINSLDSLNTI